MSSFVNKDKNILEINCALNKITETNYELIVSEIITILDKEENDEKIIELLTYICDSLYNKSISQNIFIKYYIIFLKKISDYKSKSVVVDKLKELNESFIQFIKDDKECLDTLINKKVYDNNQYKNIGVFFAQYTINFEVKNNFLLIDDYLKKIQEFLSWQPVNKVNLEININLLCSFLEELSEAFSTYLTRDEKNNILSKVEFLTKNKLIPIKVRFQIQDLYEKISNVKQSESKLTNCENELAEDTNPFENTPVQVVYDKKKRRQNRNNRNSRYFGKKTTDRTHPADRTHSGDRTQPADRKISADTTAKYIPKNRYSTNTKYFDNLNFNRNN